MDALYLTTPIYYVNGDPHIGHAHTSVTADALKRIAQMRGLPTFVTTGTDEHGQKNQQAAEESGLEVQAYLDRQSARFRELFDRLDVDYDYFVRTTSPVHRRAVSEVLTRLWDRGLIVQKLYSGLYCVGCEQFKLPRDLDPEGRCPDHRVVPVESEETNYFLRLAPFQEWLVEYLSTEGLIQPAFFRREVLAMLEEPLEDLSISRPKSRVRLGIELPFDPDYVTYVWFDALINYISSLEWPEDQARFRTWWPHATHLMAKDILKTHCIYWPIMLRALDLEPPAGYRIHGYWVGEGGLKMSKSLGNVVDPHEMVDLVGTDGLRYYLLRNMGSIDAPISQRMVLEAYNADLANSVGNLFSRVLNFAAKEGRLPAPEALHADDERVLQECVETARRTLAELEFVDLQRLPRTLLELAARLNAHIDAVAPWKLRKDPEQAERYASVIYGLMECLRIVAELAWPVMPTTSAKALALLDTEPVRPERGAHEFTARRLQPGAEFTGPVTPLFPRVALPEPETAG